MPESYLLLSDEDKRDLLRLRAQDLDMQPYLIEKDIWICWALEKLFAMPGALPMAFKGGTSLSKVYSAIDRFSEDLDVTIDYRSIGEPLKGTESRGALDRISEHLKAKVLEYSQDSVKPFFEKTLTQEFGAHNCLVELKAEGEKLFVHYPSALAEKAEYLKSAVLIEFGGRNITEPNETVTIRPYIADVAPDIDFPRAQVTVLALERTYWEKATLIHFEIHRRNPRASAERMSRHWYDLHELSRDLARFQTDEAQEILGSVVTHKKAFFHSGYANYDACLAGGLRLVPQDELREELEKDFTAMVRAGMFYNNPPTFGKILERLGEVEKALNETIASFYR